VSTTPRWRRRRTVRDRQLTRHSWTTRRETWPEYFLRLVGRPRLPKITTPYDDLLDTLTARVRSELDHPTTTEDA